jgi:AI-2 transport protein TqsA
MRTMNGNSLTPILRILLAAACTVVIMAGIRATSSILGPLLLSLLLAYAVVPLPSWIIRRFKLSKNKAILLTAVAAFAFGLFLLFALDVATLRIAQKLPGYEHQLAELYGQAAVTMNADGIVAPILSIKNVFTPERINEITRIVLPEAGDLLSHGLMVFLLAFLFVVTMVEDIGVTQGPLAEKLAYYASDAQRYVAVTAKTSGINTLLNLAFLLAMGVDTPVIWSFLYFFLNFIPTLGFVIALVPPTFVTLLMYGWKKALLVACGLILTNLIVDNVVSPIFMKQAVNVSFLEITLSLVGWAFLLGLAGAILAIPLTLSLKKFVEKSLREEPLVMEPSG